MAYRRILATPHVLALAASSVVARLPLVPAAALAAAALVAAVLLGEAGAGTAPLVVLAALSGAAMPPVGGLLRHLWPDVVEGDLLVNAYVVDSVLIEAVFITCPLLTGLLVALIDPGAALLAAALPALGIPLMLARRRMLPTPASVSASA